MSHDREQCVVTPNCRVTITGFESDDEPETYWIVDDGEADVQENKLPVSSPLASVLMGASVGKTVSFHPPSGEVALKVIEVRPM